MKDDSSDNENVNRSTTNRNTVVKQALMKSRKLGRLEDYALNVGEVPILIDVNGIVKNEFLTLSTSTRHCKARTFLSCLHSRC
jgi:hypothetical protein